MTEMTLAASEADANTFGAAARAPDATAMAGGSELLAGTLDISVAV